MTYASWRDYLRGLNPRQLFGVFLLGAGVGYLSPAGQPPAMGALVTATFALPAALVFERAIARYLTGSWLGEPADINGGDKR